MIPRRAKRQTRKAAEYRLIESSGLFDAEWYLTHYPDVRAAGVDPLDHYLLCGAGEGREPGPFFDTQWYLAQNNKLNPYRVPFAGRAFGPLVGSLQRPARDYKDSPADVRRRRLSLSKRTNPLLHYLRDGLQNEALPFDPRRLLRGMKVAVVVHVFYANLWAEIAEYLRNIPIEFDLFVSVPRENSAVLRATVFSTHPRALVSEVPNAGRDVGAFLDLLPRMHAGNYSVVCKLHTKAGSDYPEAWRDFLLRGLLGNKMLVARILHAFACDPELALVGAREVYLSGPVQMAQNRNQIDQLVQLLYPRDNVPDDWGFFAGTMFWARPDLFLPLLRCRGNHLFSFEYDNTRNDGQLAHAMERLFGLLATSEKRRIGLTTVSRSHSLENTICIVRAPSEPSKSSFVQRLHEHDLKLKKESSPVRSIVRSRESDRLRIHASLRKHFANARPGQPARIIMQGARLVWWTVSLQLIPQLHRIYRRRMQIDLLSSSPLFDRTWYLESYPDVRAAGADPVLHYIMHGAEECRNPGPGFDTAWYLSRYSDVATSGVNPLFHYLRHGITEGRHALPSDVVIGEVTDASLVCCKQADPTSELALFVSHSPDGRLKPHVRYHIAALRRHGISCVLIIAADTAFREADDPLLALLGGLYVRQNIGYDFAAWAHILRENPKLLSANMLYLINDSIVGPLNEQKFEKLLRQVRYSQADVIGLSDSYESQWHIQSYFIALRSAALTSPALVSFFDDIKNLSAKRDVVNAYEVRLAHILRAAGLVCTVLFPAKEKHYNPSLADWIALIRMGSPFVKLAALRNSSQSSGDTDWRLILQSEGFDYRLAEPALAIGPVRPPASVRRVP